MGIKASSNKFEYVKKSSSTSSLNTTLSAPNSPLDTELGRLEPFLLVWLDPDIDDDAQNVAMQKPLRKIVTFLMKFNDSYLCEQWLRHCSTDEKIIFIVSGHLGQRIVPKIHDLNSIMAIYVFCLKPDFHTIWTQNYRKVRHVTAKQEKLLQVMSQDQLHFENIEDSKAIKIFKDRHRTRVLDSYSISFIWYQLLLEILLLPSYLTLESKPDELIEILRRCSSNDKDGLSLIEEFEQTYDKQHAVTWLTNNTSLARFANKALRDQNIPMLFHLRFFLADIYAQVITHQMPSSHVYKKQLMSREEIHNIKESLNQYLVFNGFVFTSTQKPDILSIDTNDSEFQTVLIEIDAERQDGTAPFACVQQMVQTNSDQTDQTILFMCGSIFKIVSFTENNNSSWTLQLSLSADKDLNILKITKRILRERKDLLKVADLLEHCEQPGKANIYCQHLLRHIPNDHILVPQLKEKLNINPKVQPVSLNTARFVLGDLSKRLSKLSSTMLNALCALTNDSIVILHSASDTDLEQLQNKSILLFASSQFTSSTQGKFRELKSFVLEEDRNKADQRERFASSEDLIFQLADELYRYYKWEASSDLRAGVTSLAKEKEELANRIHTELKKTHQKFFATNVPTKPAIRTTTSLVWLKSKDYDDISMESVQKLFENIISPFSTFYDEHECHRHMCSNEFDNNVFLIIDTHYENSAIAGFQQLPYVKKVYRYDQSSSADSTINSNRDDFCFQLTHDLITDYNKLGTECSDKKDAEKAKNMFLKAHELSELLIQF